MRQNEAAGTVPPAKILVVGAGVAGLQAIATARGVRPTGEQIIGYEYGYLLVALNLET